MDAKSLSKRLNFINSRVKNLSAPEGFPRDFDMEKHLDSAYYGAAIHGLHPFYEQARTLSDYLDRRSYFDERRDTLIEEYGGILNQSHSNGQRWYTPFALKIGIIADEFLYKSFASTARFIPLTPDNFQEHVDDLDLLLVTSTWRGLSNEWVGASQKNSKIRKLIEEKIIPLYQMRGVPVAFYSKEDPPNYQVFLGTAQKCDFVFTSAVEMIEKYVEACPRASSVAALPFSVDYRHHNPVGSRKHRINDIVFAGSWHNHKYPERREAAMEIFDGVIASDRPLRIIDRNWKLETEKYLFPERYLPYLEPAIPHDELLQVHRTSDVVINLNSVINSSTMYANRVVELQAMGCTVISNYNAGVNDQFPNVFMPESSFDTTDIIASLDSDTMYRNQMAGLRNVFSKHVNFDRIRVLLSTCGLADSKPQVRRLAVVGPAQVSKQFIQNQSFEDKLEQYETIEHAQKAGVEAVCTLDSNHQYGRHYLQDLVNATKFVDSRSINVASPGSDRSAHHDYSSDARSKAGSLKWLNGPLLVSPTSDSAYTIDDLQVKVRDRPRIEIEPNTAKLSVIVPVYNNGRHLEFKCFESLRRSSIFDQMEIILVDDGSTDVSTIATVRDLEERYANVSAFFHETGGSGSASRPRNVGLSLATAPWVTYLDPDNEALSDGYAKLLKLAEENKSHFAIGNMIRNADRRKLVNYVRILRRHIYKQQVSEQTYSIDQSLLSKINFTPMSIQALVADTDWLRSLGIEQPLGAVGQDSYFFQQMLFYAKQISLLNEPIHAYFAAVSNSTVNTLGTKFYRKYISLERARAEWLKEIGLLEEYKNRRLEGFTKGWYLDKLKRVSPEEKLESGKLIAELVGYYGEHEWQDEELRLFFEEF